MTGNDLQDFLKIKKDLIHYFHITNLGTLKYLRLDIEVRRNKNEMHIGQRKYLFNEDT